jgi:hypothetical protein
VRHQLLQLQRLEVRDQALEPSQRRTLAQLESAQLESAQIEVREAYRTQVDQ